MAAYLIVDVQITDPEQYEKYKRQVSPLIARFGGRYLALAGNVVEASKVLGQIPPQAQSDPASNAVRAIIHFAALASDEAARSDASRASAARALLGGSPDAAIESLLSRMQGDRAFTTRAGREDLLQAFALLPADDARVAGWRRRLAALLN